MNVQPVLGALLYASGAFTVALGVAHFFFPRLLDFEQAVPRDGEALRPFRLGPVRYATTRADVRGIAWVMNHAASYVLVTVGALDLSWSSWLADSHGALLAGWIAGWWLLRAGSQLYLGRRRGDWLILAGFAALAAIHGMAALSR